MNITLLGTDIAKNVFQLHGIDDHGNGHLKKKGLFCTSSWSTSGMV